MSELHQKNILGFGDRAVVLFLVVDDPSVVDYPDAVAADHSLSSLTAFVGTADALAVFYVVVFVLAVDEPMFVAAEGNYGASAVDNFYAASAFVESPAAVSPLASVGFVYVLAVDPVAVVAHVAVHIAALAADFVDHLFVADAVVVAVADIVVHVAALAADFVGHLSVADAVDHVVAVAFVNTA